MTRFEELKLGQIWESVTGFRREIIATGPEYVTAKNPNGYILTYYKTEMNTGAFCREIKPKIKKWLLLLRFDDWYSYGLWSSKTEIENYLKTCAYPNETKIIELEI